MSSELLDMSLDQLAIWELGMELWATEIEKGFKALGSHMITSGEKTYREESLEQVQVKQTERGQNCQEAGGVRKTQDNAQSPSPREPSKKETAIHWVTGCQLGRWGRWDTHWTSQRGGHWQHSGQRGSGLKEEWEEDKTQYIDASKE